MSEHSRVLQQGWQIHQQGRVDEALAVYQQVLAKNPGDAAAHVYAGIAFFDKRRFDAAEQAYREAIRLQDPFPVAWNNLGNALRMLHRVPEADECFETALRQQPGYISALKNRGTLWIWSGQVEKGLRWYEVGLQYAPQDAELHRNLGLIYLLQGRFTEGWQEYRWRWQLPGLSRPACSAPLWQGEQLEGKSVLIYPEQGLGDAIHFVRVCQDLSQRGAIVYLHCPLNLLPLFTTVCGIHQLLLPGMPLPSVDFQCSLIEAAEYLQTYGVSVAKQTPYIAVSDTLEHYWHRWLGATTGFRIGVCWQGNPDHHADHFRSIPLETFSPLMQQPGIRWISLQHGYGSEQLPQVTFSERIEKLPNTVDQSNAFLDTAAIMKNLDLVITIDTVTAHLAGALDVPTWLILGKVPDWRWHLDTSTTPWYPSIRLFRQQRLGEWSDVMQSIVMALRAFRK